MRTPNNERLTPDIVDAQRPPESQPFGDGAVRAGKSAPERKCILSGEHGARDRLVRLAISPPQADGTCQVMPDIHAKAPGRGAWLAVDRGALEQAIDRGRRPGGLAPALARAFKGVPLSIPGDLPSRIEDGLRRSLLDRLGLELRAGHLILGSDRIAERARGGAIDLLLHARDASPDGSRKLDQAWRVGREAEGSGETGTVLPLDRAALSVAMGRDNVVHMALADPAAAARVSLALARLMHFLGSQHAAETGAETGADGGGDSPAATDD